MTARSATEPTEPQPVAASIDAIPDLWEATSSLTRWPRRRAGPREPVPGFVRWLILERDGFRCMACGIPVTSAGAELDHIVPWSAYGSDFSENLRTLCWECNQERSNFRGVLDEWCARRQPVTPRCIPCTYPDDEYNDDNDSPGDDETMPAYCGTCGTVSPSFAWATY